MPRKKSFDVARKWLELRRILNKKERLFLELLTYSYIGHHHEKTGITISKQKVERFKGGECESKFIYTLEVPIEG